jgi:hypothetical protein
MQRQLHIKKHKMGESTDHLKAVTATIANTTVVTVM